MDLESNFSTSRPEKVKTKIEELVDQKGEKSQLVDYGSLGGKELFTERIYCG